MNVEVQDSIIALCFIFINTKVILMVRVTIMLLLCYYYVITHCVASIFFHPCIE